MRGLERCRRYALGLALAWSSTLVSSALLAAAEKEKGHKAGPQVTIEDPITAGAVHWALKGAARRLEGAGCQSVLSLPRLRAQDGRLLQGGSELSTDSAGYLAQLSFVDGSDSRLCRQGAILFTSPGHRVVRVCGRRFVSEWRGNPRRAQVLLIHELLHTLGLGENPPSSEEITNIVLRTVTTRASPDRSRGRAMFRVNHPSWTCQAVRDGPDEASPRGHKMGPVMAIAPA
jgi:hypothetical protein